ncbi:MAG: adenosylcobinamide amidohydrolase [Methanocalculus sp.]|uniref:adenosylcobinamide amidohydrolase n=1 Tax=Methanocalculus sp. TaxID=2004547 RepID=UPI002724D0C2|nr:adenosylcobinamide amidohydrolase [Methanocalculus sp.]MDO9539816.1 adenosylcobinamide amidohydrolase [Methanocalculus sp.]
MLSTSWLNGGFRENLTAVFNHQMPLAACDACHANGGVKTYLEDVAASLSLDPAATSGLITRAEMRNAAIVSATHLDLYVTAVVTAGIDKNGGRAGDPSSYHETGGRFEPVGGTINTILIIGADLPEYAMTRAVMTATEAKVAALQQLMARSIYSSGIATGSGTDMIAIVTNPGSPHHLSDTGKHSKLGELIGITVIRATIAALEKETGLSPASQRDVLVRLSRFGITEEDLWKDAVQRGYVKNTRPEERERFMQYLKSWAREPGAVAQAAAALHVLDEVGWGLLPQAVTQDTIIRILVDGEKDIPAAGDRPLDCVIAMLARQAARGFPAPRNLHRSLLGTESAGPK